MKKYFSVLLLSVIFSSVGYSVQEKILGSVVAVERAFLIDAEACINNMQEADWDQSCRIEVVASTGTEQLTSSESHIFSAGACNVKIFATTTGYGATVRGSANYINRKQAAACLKQVLSRSGFDKKPITARLHMVN